MSVNDDELDEPASGKTLRDEFAMAALTAILGGSNVIRRSDGRAVTEESDIAVAAYAYADAMLAARQKAGA